MWLIFATQVTEIDSRCLLWSRSSRPPWHAVRSPRGGCRRQTVRHSAPSDFFQLGSELWVYASGCRQEALGLVALNEGFAWRLGILQVQQEIL